jgi:hypothetical protein
MEFIRRSSFSRKDWKNRIIDYKWISRRIVQLGLKILTYTVTIIGIYAPLEGKTTETEEFYDELQAAVDRNNKQDYLILTGDFNVRVGAQPVDKHMGSEGEQTVNNNGRDLIDFCLFNKLKITNTFFRHKNVHKFTWEARGVKSIIDYSTINENLNNAIRDTRVFRGSEIDTDHYLLESTFKIHRQYHTQRRSNNLIKINKTLKIHLLEKESIRILFENGLKDKLKQVETYNVEGNWTNIK